MSLAGQRILILEDEPIIALALEDMLVDRGAKPVIAERLDEAFALVEQGSFDAAILDVNLHGGRSFPLAQQLLERGLPFIFATGYGDAPQPDAFAGVPIVAKPYGLDELERALDAAAER